MQQRVGVRRGNMGLQVCLCESQKNDDQDRAESERCQRAAMGISGTRRKFPYDFAAQLLYCEEKNVACNLCVTYRGYVFRRQVF